MHNFRLKYDKKSLLKSAWHIFLIIAGTAILAFGSACFLVPFNIISGGVTGLALLFKDIIPLDVDVLAGIFTGALFLFGLIFLGAKFSLTTLLSSILYPLILSLALRSGIADYIVSLIINQEGSVLADGLLLPNYLSTVETGTLLIVGMLGGACVGVGCSLTFIGGGSTGGLDILSFIINKFTGIKQSILFFLTDSIIVGAGLIIDLTKHNSILFVAGLVGIIAAFICSFMVEVVYVSKEGAFNVDIVTDKPNEIVDYARNEINRTATLFKVTGAYSKEEKTMVRITFNRREYTKIKDGIAKIDPNAFVTFSQTMLVGGEGFSKIKSSDTNLITDTKKAIKDYKQAKENNNNIDDK